MSLWWVVSEHRAAMGYGLPFALDVCGRGGVSIIGGWKGTVVIAVPSRGFSRQISWYWPSDDILRV